MYRLTRKQLTQIIRISILITVSLSQACSQYLLMSLAIGMISSSSSSDAKVDGNLHVVTKRQAKSEIETYFILSQD